MQFLTQSNFDFVAKSTAAFVFSAALIVIGIGSLVIHGGPNYGIDFLGGTSLGLSFKKEVSVGEMRDLVSAAGFKDAEIKSFGHNGILIRLEAQEASVDSIIRSRIALSFPDNPDSLLLADRVGPKIGAELRTDMIFAILVALFGILLYISWRFEFGFAIGAIVALFHDILITLGVFSVLNLELTLPIIAAFLTIVGYSLNDTIVVYDRIRENLKIMRRDNYETVVNASINQSLTRTLVTSLTTLIVVTILYFFGGEVIHNFAFALIVGIVIGTYSSIFVASPIVVEWHKRREAKAKQSKQGKPVPKRA